MATEQDHTWSILDDMLVFLSGQGVPTPERTYKFDGGWTLAMADLRKYVSTLRAELAAARLEIEALRVKPWQEQIEGQSAVISRLRYEKGVAEAEAAELRAHVERLRVDFARIMTTDENGNSMTWPQIDEMVRPLLAATPAQSLAACKADTLREIANLIQQTTPGRTSQYDDYGSGKEDGRHYAIEQIESEAERLQEEMRKDGKDG